MPGAQSRDVLFRKASTLFHEGNVKALMSMWRQSVPASVRNNDETCIAIEAQLWILGFVLKKQGFSKEKLKRWMQTNADRLTKCDDEDGKLFCLPFVKNPSTHPKLKHVFRPAFKNNLSKKYIEIITKNSERRKLPGKESATDEPKLQKMWQQEQDENKDITQDMIKVLRLTSRFFNLVESSVENGVVIDNELLKQAKKQMGDISCDILRKRKKAAMLLDAKGAAASPGLESVSEESLPIVDYGAADGVSTRGLLSQSFSKDPSEKALF